jgi:protein-histidine pros-kinase
VRHPLPLINDLLDLARIESGEVEMNLDPVVWQQVVRELTKTLATLAARVTIRVRAGRLPGQPLPVD